MASGHPFPEAALSTGTLDVWGLVRARPELIHQCGALEAVAAAHLGVPDAPGLLRQVRALAALGRLRREEVLQDDLPHVVLDACGVDRITALVPDVRRALAGGSTGALARSRLLAALAEVPALPSVGHAAVDAVLARQRSEHQRALKTHALFVSPGGGPQLDARAVSLAVDWLARPEAVADLREHQAEGVDGSGPLTETRWLKARVALALARAGRAHGRRRLHELLDTLGDAAPRWYDGWAGVPPDADSLGTWLEACAAVGVRPPEPWLESLAQAPMPTPTWLSGAAGWGGDDCPAVRLRLLVGAGRCGLGLDRWQVDLDSIDPARLADLVFHYSPARALGFALQAAAAWPGLASEQLVDQLLEQARVLQCWDGGFGDPLATAGVWLGLAELGQAGLAAELAGRYLRTVQRPDGSWRAVPDFVIPGRAPETADRFGHPAYTTAAVVEASAAWGCAGACP